MPLAQGLNPESAAPKLDKPIHDRDVALLRRIARREETAFCELFDHRAPAILGVLSRVLDRTQAEEVLLEVFTEVWEQGSRFHPNGTSPFSWMLQLARKRAAERLRAARQGHVARSTETPVLQGASRSHPKAV